MNTKLGGYILRKSQGSTNVLHLCFKDLGDFSGLTLIPNPHQKKLLRDFFSGEQWSHWLVMRCIRSSLGNISELQKKWRRGICLWGWRWGQAWCYRTAVPSHLRHKSGISILEVVYSPWCRRKKKANIIISQVSCVSTLPEAVVILVSYQQIGVGGS